MASVEAARVAGSADAASATAIISSARLLGLGSNLTAKDVYDMAIAGNPKAKRVFVCMGEAVGMLLATLINIFDFPLYLIAGGVIAGWDLFAPPMLDEAARRSFTYGITKPRVEKAKLGNEAGLYGAACLPWSED